MTFSITPTFPQRNAAALDRARAAGVEVLVAGYSLSPERVAIDRALIPVG